MVLTDKELAEVLAIGELVVTPIINPDKQLGASSIDLRLGTEFIVEKIFKRSHFDVTLPPDQIRNEIERYSENIQVAPMSSFILHPGEFALGSTLEYLVIPNNLAGRIEGRSTWGRVGLQIHSTAAIIDPGFEGTITLELYNLGNFPIPLYPGVRIAQIIIYKCGGNALRSYKEKGAAKYSHSIGAKRSMFFEDDEYSIIRTKMNRKEKKDDVEK